MYGTCGDCGWEGNLAKLAWRRKHRYLSVPLCLLCRHERRTALRALGATDVHVFEVTHVTRPEVYRSVTMSP